MMKLTQRQVDYINAERQVLLKLIKAKEDSKVHRGLITDYARLQAIDLAINLHNLEIGDEKANQAKD